MEVEILQQMLLCQDYWGWHTEKVSRFFPRPIFVTEPSGCFCSWADFVAHRSLFLMVINSWAAGCNTPPSASAEVSLTAVTNTSFMLLFFSLNIMKRNKLPLHLCRKTIFLLSPDISNHQTLQFQFTLLLSLLTLSDVINVFATSWWL